MLVLGVEQLRRFSGSSLVRRSFLIVIGLSFYAWSVPGPGAITVNRQSPPAFKEPTVSRKRQTLK